METKFFTVLAHFNPMYVISDTMATVVHLDYMVMWTRLNPTPEQ